MFKPLLEWIDQSPNIKQVINWLSTTLATRRGLPVIATLVLTIVSLIVQLLAAFSGNLIILVCGISVLHIAVIIGFLGILLAEPLGRG